MTNRRTTRRRSPLFKFLAFFLVAVFIFLFVKLNTRYWNGRDRVSVVVQEKSGDTKVFVFDPVLEESTTFVIPGEVEVELARNLGTLRLKNVWQLGVNEHLGGKLLAETITRNFLFPVFLWKGENGTTNVPLGDRLFLWFFEKRLKEQGRSEIDLAKSSLLKKQKLSDGETGFKISGQIPEKLTVYFSDKDFADESNAGKNVRVYIKDATGTFGVADTIGKIIEVLGGKVVSIEKGEREDFDCEVWGRNKDIALKVRRLFSCEISKRGGDFDLEIKLGQKFAKRF